MLCIGCVEDLLDKERAINNLALKIERTKG